MSSAYNDVLMWLYVPGIMTLVETLEFVKFEWNGDRNVKVKIRNATLTFST